MSLTTTEWSRMTLCKFLANANRYITEKSPKCWNVQSNSGGSCCGGHHCSGSFGLCCCRGLLVPGSASSTPNRCVCSRYNNQCFFLAPCSKNSMQLLSTFDLLAWSAPEVPTTAGCISDRHRLSGTWLAPLEIDKMQLKGVSVAAILEQRGPKALCVRVRELRALKLRATEWKCSLCPLLKSF